MHRHDSHRTPPRDEAIPLASREVVPGIGTPKAMAPSTQTRLGAAP
jgi:hypothetical protein